MLKINTKVNVIRLVMVALLFLVGKSHAETLMRGPYLQNGAVDGATVMWRTDSAVVGKVWYGTTPGSLTQSVTGGSATDHSIRITGLAPETKYYYKIGNDAGGVLAGDDANHYWVTNPVVGSTDSVRIWAIGDSGTKDDSARAVRDAYLELAGQSGKADVWLMLGDNAYSSGTDIEYQTSVFENMYEDVLRNTMLWSTQGNHDGLDSYLNIFDLPKNGEGGGLASNTEHYYSFDYGNVHFVCLSSQELSLAGNEGSAMYTWLSNDLAATNQEWIVAFFHHPPYTKGTHDSDNSADSGGRMDFMREIALPLLEAGGVDLVLSGHSHSYERTKFINGHYGLSSTFDAGTHVVQSGNGSSDGSYQKTTFDGAIYIVAGSSGKKSGALTQHPAMESWINQLGSVVIDVSDKQMDVSFLREFTGPVQIDDQFTIIHGVAPPSPPTFTYDPFSTSAALVDAAYIDSISTAAKDFNDDLITFAKVSGPAWLSVASDGTLSGTPLLADLGLNVFTVSATDVDGSASASLEIFVREETLYFQDFSADPGYVSDNATSIGAAGGLGTYFTFGQYNGTSDIGATTATGVLHIDSNTSGGSARSRGLSVFIDTSAAGAGTYTVSFDVSNWVAGTGTAGFKVLEGHGLDTGYIELDNSSNSATGSSPDFAGTATSAEIGSTGAGGTGILGNGTVSLEITLTAAGQPGDYLALAWTQVRSTSTTVAPTFDVDNVWVGVAGGNQAPAFTVDPINKANGDENSAYSGSIAGDASDPEADVMIFSKVSGPAWLSVDSNGALSGTPAAGDVGANVFTVQVDATGGSDTATLNITVDAQGTLSLYEEDFSADPGYVSSNATAIGAVGSANAYFIFGQYNGTPDIGVTTGTGVLHIDSNTSGGSARSRGLSLFIDTSAAAAGTYTVSFDVSNWVAGTGSAGFEVLEGNGLDAGYIQLDNSDNNTKGSTPNFGGTATSTEIGSTGTSGTGILGNGTVSFDVDADRGRPGRGLSGVGMGSGQVNE